MTPEQRKTLTDELDLRSAYAEAVRVRGPEHYLVKLRPGWGSRTWDGRDPMVFDRKATARKHVLAMATGCQKRASEIRAQIGMAEWDAEMAVTTDEERVESLRAYEAARFPRWRARRSA